MVKFILVVVILIMYSVLGKIMNMCAEIILKNHDSHNLIPSKANKIYKYGMKRDMKMYLVYTIDLHNLKILLLPIRLCGEHNFCHI